MAEPGELKEGAAKSAERGKRSVELAKKAGEGANKIKEKGLDLAKKIRAGLKKRLKDSTKISKSPSPKVGRKAGAPGLHSINRAASERASLRRQVKVTDKHIANKTAHTDKFRKDLARAARLPGSSDSAKG